MGSTILLVDSSPRFSHGTLRHLFHEPLQKHVSWDSVDAAPEVVASDPALEISGGSVGRMSLHQPRIAPSQGAQRGSPPTGDGAVAGGTPHARPGLPSPAAAATRSLACGICLGDPRAGQHIRVPLGTPYKGACTPNAAARRNASKSIRRLALQARILANFPERHCTPNAVIVRRQRRGVALAATPCSLDPGFAVATL